MVAMTYESGQVRSDIMVIKNALKRRDFQHINIQCNRIMSNSFLFKQPKFALPAFIIRDLNMLLSALQRSRDSKPVSSATAIFEQLVSRIDQVILIQEGEIDNKKLWDNYYTCLKILRHHLLNDTEIDYFDYIFGPYHK